MPWGGAVVHRRLLSSDFPSCCTERCCPLISRHAALSAVVLWFPVMLHWVLLSSDFPSCCTECCCPLISSHAALSAVVLWFPVMLHWVLLSSDFPSCCTERWQAPVVPWFPVMLHWALTGVSCPLTSRHAALSADRRLLSSDFLSCCTECCCPLTSRHAALSADRRLLSSDFLSCCTEHCCPQAPVVLWFPVTLHWALTGACCPLISCHAVLSAVVLWFPVMLHWVLTGVCCPLITHHAALSAGSRTCTDHPLKADLMTLSLAPLLRWKRPNQRILGNQEHIMLQSDRVSSKCVPLGKAISTHLQYGF